MHFTLWARRTLAVLHYIAKLDPFVSLDCAGMEGGKESNFAIWQHCSPPSYAEKITANNASPETVPFVVAHSLILLLRSNGGRSDNLPFHSCARLRPPSSVAASVLRGVLGSLHFLIAERALLQSLGLPCCVYTRNQRCASLMIYNSFNHSQLQNSSNKG